MATIYVRSTDGNNADSGATWALAKATLAGAGAIAAAGDTIYVSQAHSESTAANPNIVWPGTNTAPNKIVCGNDGAAPPTAVATTGAMATTGTNGISHYGSIYVYGLTFNVGTGAGAQHFFGHTDGFQSFEQCVFSIVNTAATSLIIPAWTTSASPTGPIGIAKWKTCSIKFANAGQKILIASSFHWCGGGVVSGSSSPTVLLGYDSGQSVVEGGNVLIENVDFSNFGTSFNLSNAPPGASKVTIRNCLLPASWSGALLNGSFARAGRIEMYNCDSGSTNYKVWIEDYLGSIKDETTLVRTGGASDGATPISWKMVSSANATYPLNALASPEFVIYNATTGSSKTVTVEILRDSATNLTDAEVWLEVNYLGTSGFPIGSLVSDAAADVLTAAADQAASSVTWTTTGMANPNKQKLAVTFTPQKKGPFYCRVMLAKASTTIYVDPLATVS